MSKFWGIILEPGKRYTQKIETGFCISMAVLESDQSPVKLYAERDKVQFLLCALSPKVNQLPLRIKFGKGETVSLYFLGGHPAQKLHLSGYTINDDTLVSIPFKGQQQSILMSEPNSADKNNKLKKRVSIKESPEATRKASSSEDDSEDDLDLDDEDVAIIKVNGSPKKSDKFISSLSGGAIAKKLNLKEEEDESDDDEDEDVIEEEDEEDDTDDSSDEEDTPPQSSKKLKIEQQQPKSNALAQLSPKHRKSEPAQVPTLATPENQNIKLKQPSSAGHTPMRMFSKSGVMCQDIKVGTGNQAKIGKMLTVYYCGRLKGNNKKFDANETGPGFKFRLGKGEVIKGWDLGVEGMKIGGKRKLIVPANLGYGKRGAPPDIPPNAQLQFEVELKNVS